MDEGVGQTQRPLPDNTEHLQETDIHAPERIQTLNPSKLATTDPHLRLRNRRDRLCL